MRHLLNQLYDYLIWFTKTHYHVQLSYVRHFNGQSVHFHKIRKLNFYIKYIHPFFNVNRLKIRPIPKFTIMFLLSDTKRLIQRPLLRNKTQRNNVDYFYFQLPLIRGCNVSLSLDKQPFLIEGSTSCL